MIQDYSNQTNPHPPRLELYGGPTRLPMSSQALDMAHRVDELHGMPYSLRPIWHRSPEIWQTRVLALFREPSSSHAAHNTISSMELEFRNPGKRIDVCFYVRGPRAGHKTSRR